MKETKKRIIVGASGASGMPILIRCLKLIKEAPDYEAYLIMSDNAKKTLEQETQETAESLALLADEVISPKEIGAAPASG